MAEIKSFDSAETDLLLCDERFGNADLDDELTHQGNGCGGSDSAPFVLLPSPTEDSIRWMLIREKQHSPRDDYLARLRNGDLDLGLRSEALDWMIKACGHHNFGESSLYLAMNYFDRFLSVYTLPGGRGWTIQLIAVSCLSLAAKIEEVFVPSTVDIQVGFSKYLFEGKTVQRMEILVMNYLKWNMKSCTPFSFIEYFLRKINGDDLMSQAPLLARSIRVILSTIRGVDFLEFKASEIAAAVAVYVSQAVDVDALLPGFNKDRVVKCLDLISTNMDTVLPTSRGNSLGAASIPYTPNGVLDAGACLSSKSDENSETGINKRRKLDT